MARCPGNRESGFPDMSRARGDSLVSGSLRENGCILSNICPERARLNIAGTSFFLSRKNSAVLCCVRVGQGLGVLFEIGFDVLIVYLIM